MSTKRPRTVNVRSPSGHNYEVKVRRSPDPPRIASKPAGAKSVRYFVAEYQPDSDFVPNGSIAVVTWEVMNGAGVQYLHRHEHDRLSQRAKLTKLETKELEKYTWWELWTWQYQGKEYRYAAPIHGKISEVKDEEPL